MHDLLVENRDDVDLKYDYRWIKKTKKGDVEMPGQQCDLLTTCGFFKKYHTVKTLACKGFIAQYCKGPKMDQCMRKKYRKKSLKNTVTV